MRVVQVARYGPPEVLKIAEQPDPVPTQDQVLIQVRAAGVNFADLMMRMGLYPEAPPRPFVPGYEVAGIAEGRRVVAVTRFGGYSEKVAVPRRKVFPLPDLLSFEEGAAVPVVYLTAWCALEGIARVRPGDRVLIHSAAGGVGLAAIQLAKRRTDRITGVVGSAEKAEFLRTLGVTPVVRGRDELRGPFDVILNNIGGKSVLQDMNLLAPLGRIVLYGATDVVGGTRRSVFRALGFLMRQPSLKPIWLMNQNKAVGGLNLLQLWDAEEPLQDAMADILSGVGGWLKPRVDRVFPLERAAEAHAYLQARKNIGKVVLTV